MSDVRVWGKWHHPSTRENYCQAATPPGILCQVDFVRKCDAITQFHGLPDCCILMTHAPSRMLKEDEWETQAGEKPSFERSFKTMGQGKPAAGWTYVSISQIPDHNLSCFTLFFFTYSQTFLLLVEKKIAQNPTLAQFVKTILKIT